MAQAAAHRSISVFLVGVVEHAAFVVFGFVLMILGLGLSVKIIMLPAGLTLGLLGFAMFVGGMTVHMDRP